MALLMEPVTREEIDTLVVHYKNVAKFHKKQLELFDDAYADLFKFVDYDLLDEQRDRLESNAKKAELLYKKWQNVRETLFS